MFLWVYVIIFSGEGNNFGIMEWLTIDWLCLFLLIFVYRISYKRKEFILEYVTTEGH